MNSVAAIAKLRIFHAKNVRDGTAKAIPVLVYHEMNNGCKPTDIICKGNDPESVSSRQFHDEMYYLFSAGYHTVTLTQYLHWLANPRIKLPSKPLLITADNGIFSFLNGAQETLANYGFTAVAAVVTGFADAASGQCAPRDGTINVQPGCPGENRYWDATWSQLKGFSQQGVWSFMLEAGRSGHYVQHYDSKCNAFDTCLLPHESLTAYEKRTATEFDNAGAELKAELGNRYSPNVWVVPYSDLGYKRCAQSNCTPQPATIPQNYLVHFASSVFQAVFVEDAFRNGHDHERFRFDIFGDCTEHTFQHTLASYISAGYFNRR